MSTLIDSCCIDACGALYLCPLSGGGSSEPQLLITLDSAASDIGTSPDGSVLSFIVVGDLWLCPLANGAGGLSAGTPSPVTNVGVPPIAAVPLAAKLQQNKCCTIKLKESAA